MVMYREFDCKFLRLDAIDRRLQVAASQLLGDRRQLVVYDVIGSRQIHIHDVRREVEVDSIISSSINASDVVVQVRFVVVEQLERDADGLLGAARN